MYRNYSTSAMGRVSTTIFGHPSLLITVPQLPLRPTAGIQTVIDLVRTDVDSPRTLWSTKVGHCLSHEYRIFNLEPVLRSPMLSYSDGLRLSPPVSTSLPSSKPGNRRYFSYSTTASVSTPVPQVFLPSSHTFIAEFLIADLAFAARSITTMTISSPQLLAEVLDKHPPSAIITDADFFSHIIEQIYDLNQHHHTTVIVVGDPGNVGAKLVKEMDLLKFSDVEKEGASTPVDLSPPTGEPRIETMVAKLTALQTLGMPLLLLSPKPRAEQVSRPWSSPNKI